LGFTFPFLGEDRVSVGKLAFALFSDVDDAGAFLLFLLVVVFYFISPCTSGVYEHTSLIVPAAQLSGVSQFLFSFFPAGHIGGELLRCQLSTRQMWATCVCV
jgi:hypothetical protein